MTSRSSSNAVERAAGDHQEPAADRQCRRDHGARAFHRDPRARAARQPAPSRGRRAETADLWRWHAVEEIEHKGVAYDTWLHATRDWPRCKRWKVKAKVMLLVTRNFVVDRTAGALELMRQDGVTGLTRLGAAAVVLVGAAGHVPQDRRRLVQIFPARLPSVERGRPRSARAPTTRARQGRSPRRKRKVRRAAPKRPTAPPSLAVDALSNRKLQPHQPRRHLGAARAAHAAAR